MIPISSSAKWAKKSIIVAGDSESGSAIHELDEPCGICLDYRDGTIFIADSSNHRIVAWKQNDGVNVGRIVAGGNGPGDQMNELDDPTDVVIDKETDSLIIADRGNSRVVQWPLQSGTKQGQVIIENIDCYGLAMNKKGNLYVSDSQNDEVRQYTRGDQMTTVVAGGNESGDRHNQLNSPTYVFVDDEDAVYVSDTGNDRVMKWMKGAQEGIIVAGGRGTGDDLKQLCNPAGIFVDTKGVVYIADSGNKRVVRWRKGMHKGEIIIDGNEEDKSDEEGKSEDEAEKHELDEPISLTFDHQGRLFVVDTGNHQVQRFNMEKSTFSILSFFGLKKN